MSELASVPGVIPYMEPHDGQRRLLTVTSESVGLFSERARPVITVDGRSFQVMWGPITFEIPADRNVHIAAHVIGGDAATGLASILLEPGFHNEALGYRLQSMRNTTDLVRLNASY